MNEIRDASNERRRQLLCLTIQCGLKHDFNVLAVLGSMRAFLSPALRSISLFSIFRHGTLIASEKHMENVVAVAPFCIKRTFALTAPVDF